MEKIKGFLGKLAILLGFVKQGVCDGIILFLLLGWRNFVKCHQKKNLFKICISTMISIDYNSKTAKSHFCLSHCSQSQSFDCSSYSSSQWWTECATKIRTRNTGTRVPQMVARKFQFLSLRIYGLQPTIFLGVVVDFFIIK